MKKYKFKVGIVSILLTFVLLFNFIFPLFEQSNSYELNTNEKIRTINTNEICNTSVEDEIEEFLSQFDSYECIVDEESGQIVVREEKYIDNAIEIYETYINYLDNETMDFMVVISSCYDNAMIEEASYIIQPYYDEEEDEFYIVFEDELILISEIIGLDYLENCIAIADDLAVGLAVLGVAAIIIAYPYIEQVVTTIVTMVIQRVKSFFGWLKNLFVTKTVTQTIITTVVNYQIYVFGRDFVLEKINTTAPPRGVNSYHLAVVVGTAVYISIEEIYEDEAINVLASFNGYKVRIEETEFQLNTYTNERSRAEHIALQAAICNGYSGVTMHNEHSRNNKGDKAGVYFKHYHPCQPYVNGTPHSFFDIPIINA